MAVSILKLCRIATLLLTFTANAAPLNHYQVIGSHNSYKQPLNPEVQHWLTQQAPDIAVQIDYSHLSLVKQLNKGLRQLEIDVVADPRGGHYAHPWAETRFPTLRLTDGQRLALQMPGFKVLHIPGLDFNSHCITFSKCLLQLRQWSDAHPQHFPVMIMLNAKENQPNFVKQKPPVLFDTQQYASLDEEILSGLGQQKLYTPDDLRAQHATLNQAMLRKGWPDIGELAGKFIFLFDANAEQAELYRQRHPSLQGRMMFSSYPAGEEESAIIVSNDPIQQQQYIRHLVKQGYLVRTRADADFTASNAQKLTQFNAAKTSGAQWISTDWYSGSPQQVTNLNDYQVYFTKRLTALNTNDWLRFNPLFQQ